MYREKMQKRIEEAVMESYDSMYRIAMVCIGSETDAVHIVRESAYKAIRDAAKVKNERYIDTWLCQILVNKVMEYLNKNQRGISLEALFDVRERGQEDMNRDISIERMLEALSARQRIVVILHFLENKKIQEIAVILNANVSTVNSLLYRSLKKLGIEMMEGELQYGG